MGAADVRPGSSSHMLLDSFELIGGDAQATEFRTMSENSCGSATFLHGFELSALRLRLARNRASRR